MKTNQQLQADVLAELEYDPSIETKKISVVVTDGIVTLTGNLPTWTERDAASRVAWNAAGVMTVNNQITVGL